jgi:hypothetical protein
LPKLVIKSAHGSFSTIDPKSQKSNELTLLCIVAAGGNFSKRVRERAGGRGEKRERREEERELTSF